MAHQQADHQQQAAAGSALPAEPDLAGARPAVPLSHVAEAAAARLQSQLAALLADLPASAPPARAPQLLGFLHGAREQLLRLGALLHDPRKLAAAARAAERGGALDVAAAHARALQAAADELFRANAGLRLGRVPLLNVHDALDVLATGERTRDCIYMCVCACALALLLVRLCSMPLP